MATNYEVLLSGLDRGEWSGSRSCRLRPGERERIAQYIAGWVSPSGKIPAVLRNRTPVSQAVATLLSNRDLCK